MFLSWIWFAILKYDKDCLEKVVKELKLLKVVVTVMVTVQWSFLAVTNPVMMVNDHWPGVILSLLQFQTKAARLNHLKMCSSNINIFLLTFWSRGYN